MNTFTLFYVIASQSSWRIIQFLLSKPFFFIKKNYTRIFDLSQFFAHSFESASSFKVYTSPFETQICKKHTGEEAHSPDCEESEIEQVHPPVVPHVEEVVSTSRSECEEHSSQSPQQVVIMCSCQNCKDYCTRSQQLHIPF